MFSLLDSYKQGPTFKLLVTILVLLMTTSSIFVQSQIIYYQEQSVEIIPVQSLILTPIRQKQKLQEQDLEYRAENHEQQYQNTPQKQKINSQQIQEPPKLTQKCIDVLPYRPVNINHQFYASWYGKVGQSITSKTYQPGHVFSRHIAINYKCTDQQRRQNKTVFYDQNQFYKALAKDTTNCTMTSQKQFNFRQNHVIPAPSDYIKGIDCVTGVIHMFPSYFAEFKRTIQNARPTQEQYMASRYATVWTFYPKR